MRSRNRMNCASRRAALAPTTPSSSSMREEEFEPIAQDWLAKAKHPKFGRLFKQCTFQPQLELLKFLREKGFKTYIVSGGGIDFMAVLIAWISISARKTTLTIHRRVGERRSSPGC